jgi:hypothetical protein
MKKLRVFYVPNEGLANSQRGIRRAFRDLLSASLIEEVEIFSLQRRIQTDGDPETHRQDLISRIISFQPDIVLMQHLGSTGLADAHFKKMRSGAEFQLIYHEGDPYSKFLHPLPTEARSAGRAADVVFTVGSGQFRNNFVRYGATDVRWASSAFDPGRNDSRNSSLSLEREFDVVVVANRNRPRLRGLPNWRDRIDFVHQLQKTFGDRLAVYGRGWTGPSAKGPIDYSRQYEAISKGWISANWDHFAIEPSYFSDRLPISLAVGSIHATTFHEGYSEIFGQGTKEFFIARPTVPQLITSIQSYLNETSTDQRLAAIRAASDFSQRHFRQDDQLVMMLNFAAANIDVNASSSSWNLSASD